MMEILDIVRQKCFSERTVEQVGDVLVSQTLEEIGEVVQTFPQQRCHHRTVDQSVDVSVLHGAQEVREDILDEQFGDISQELISERNGEQFVDELDLRVMKDIVVKLCLFFSSGVIMTMTMTLRKVQTSIDRGLALQA